MVVLRTDEEESVALSRLLRPAPRQPGARAHHDLERWRLKALLIGTPRACRSAGAAQLHPHTRRDFLHHAHRRLSAVLANSKLLGGHQITADCGSAARATGALPRYSCHVGRTSRSCSAPLRCVLLNAPSPLLLSGLFPGAADHPLTQMDERVLMPARHGIGQPAQLDCKLVQMLAQRRDSHETATTSTA